MLPPLVSVVVTSYNQRVSLERAINSVLNQTYQNIQIVIADDYSSDDSRSYLVNLKKRYPEKIKLIFQDKNVGIPKNKNTGFKSCDGEFISYLDGDDFYFPEKIEREIKVFRTNPGLDIVYSKFVFTDLDGRVMSHWSDDNWIPLVGDIFAEVYSRKFPRGTLYRCELIKKSLLREVDYYDQNIQAYHDWDSRIRMTKIGIVGHSNYVGSAYVDDPRGISRTETKLRLLQEMVHVLDKNRKLIRDKKLFADVKLLRAEVSFQINLFYPRHKRFLGYVNHILYTKGGIKRVLRYAKNRLT